MAKQQDSGETDEQSAAPRVCAILPEEYVARTEKTVRVPTHS